MKLKGCLASISFLLSTILNSSQSALHVTGLHLLSSAKKKIYDFEKIEVGSMNFRGTKKLILMVSHDHWVRNRKIVFYGI